MPKPVHQRIISPLCRFRLRFLIGDKHRVMLFCILYCVDSYSWWKIVWYLNGTARPLSTRYWLNYTFGSRYTSKSVFLELCRALLWCHNERDGVSNQLRFDCLLSRFFRQKSKKASKFRVTRLCERKSPLTREFPAQRPSKVQSVSFW